IIKNRVVKKPMIICGREVKRANVSGIMEDILRKAGIEYVEYSNVPPEPEPKDVEVCRAFARGENPDCIIGIGGGSSMDAAKLVAALVNNDGEVESFIGPDLIRKPGIFSIMVPTTAGSGSEVTHNSVLKLTEQRTKNSVISPYIVPGCAVIDPMMMTSMSRLLTASTGMDALSHAIESYTSRRANSFSKMFARESITAIFANAVNAYEDGMNMTARQAMSFAAMLGGVSVSNTGTTVVHAMGYALSVLKNISHGLANALVLPVVMRFNAEERPDLFASLYDVISPDNNLTSTIGKSDGFINELYKLQSDLGLGGGLKEFGVKEDDLPELSRSAFDVKRSLQNSCRQPDLDDIQKLFKDSY
ncbi:MAG: iron-containing alcohol dehydrogenase, partial [Actinobacteria bacterium]|nr:iron-containing alcohol dehydrogenase [Actinomycetota bacterium]